MSPAELSVKLKPPCNFHTHHRPQEQSSLLEGKNLPSPLPHPPFPFPKAANFSLYLIRSYASF